jgi:hypothetical protein
VIDLVAEAFDLQSYLERLGWRFCFIGGLAVQAWGEPRLTRDIDISLMTGFGGEFEYIDGLLARYEARLPDTREFALRTRTLLLRSPHGVGVDVSLAALPYEDGMIARAVRVEFAPGKPLLVCSAEDLVVTKLFAGRDTDVRDARSVAVRQPGLNWSFIERALAELDELRGSSGLVEAARRIRAAIT